MVILRSKDEMISIYNFCKNNGIVKTVNTYSLNLGEIEYIVNKFTKKIDMIKGIVDLVIKNPTGFKTSIDSIKEILDDKNES